MTYCPRCKFEYDVAQLVCPECSEVLVDAIRISNHAAVVPDDSWVVVAGVESGPESDLAKGSLDSGNIPSVTMSPSLHASVGGLASGSSIDADSDEAAFILVPREFQHEAVVILRSVLGEHFGELDETNY